MSSNEYAILDREFSDLSEIEKLAVWNIRKWRPYARLYPSRPPTPDSIATIESELGCRIPSLYIELAKVTPNYGAWFGSIGNDYDSALHVLNLNDAFHIEDEESAALPADFVLLNHGHDGQCDCWKLGELKDGDYPIYRINVEARSAPRVLAESFKEYWLSIG